MVNVVVIARVLLVVVFATAGVAKAIDRPATRRSLVGFGVPDALSHSATWILVGLELVVAALLCTSSTARLGGALALVLLTAFCIAAGVNLSRGRTPECNCFGQVHSEPVGPKLLVRNGLFALAALVVVAGGASDPGPNLWAWVGELSTTEAVLVSVIAVLALLVVLQEVRLRAVEEAHAALADVVARATDGDVVDVSESDPQPPAAPQFAPGLPIGSTAPAFALDSTRGRLALEDLLAEGRPLVILFVAPTCGTCHELLPKPAAWAETYGDVLTFALVTAGSREANDGISDVTGGFEPVLFDPGLTRSAYEVAATPGGVVINRDGVVETETVYGVAEIAMLVMRAAAAERSRLPPVA